MALYMRAGAAGASCLCSGLAAFSEKGRGASAAMAASSLSAAHAHTCRQPRRMVFLAAEQRRSRQHHRHEQRRREQRLRPSGAPGARGAEQQAGVHVAVVAASRRAAMITRSKRLFQTHSTDAKDALRARGARARGGGLLFSCLSSFVTIGVVDFKGSRWY